MGELRLEPGGSLSAVTHLTPDCASTRQLDSTPPMLCLLDWVGDINVNESRRG